MSRTRMFRADYSGETESEYFYCGKNIYNQTIKDVVEDAKQYGDLVELYQVDQRTECLNNLRLVWH